MRHIDEFSEPARGTPEALVKEIYDYKQHIEYIANDAHYYLDIAREIRLTAGKHRNRGVHCNQIDFNLKFRLFFFEKIEFFAGFCIHLSLKHMKSESPNVTQ